MRKILTKRAILLCLFLWQMGGLILAQGGAHRIYLLGNAADIPADATFTRHLIDELRASEKPFTLLLNGDLTQPGADPEQPLPADSPVLRILEAVEDMSLGQVIILPGDRDWNDSRKAGLKQAIGLEKQIKRMDLERTIWPIKRGCPGPKRIELSENLVMIAMNTQWWNHPFDKPRPSDAECKTITESGFFEEVEDLVEENKYRNIVLAGHYPIRSNGNYGGRFSVAQRLAPLPIIGSFKTAFHAHIGGRRDISNANYSRFVNVIQKMMFDHEGLIYLSGHEHNQQVLEFDKHYLVNSGAPIKSGYAAQGASAMYCRSQPGLMRIDFEANWHVTSELLVYDAEDGIASCDRLTLFRSPCEPGVGPANPACGPCEQQAEVTRPATPTLDTFYIAAGPEYQRNRFGRFWAGDHYRDDWVAPVKVPHLDLDTTFGGLMIYEKGGGRQTTSLKFRSGQGQQYVLRSVNKNVRRALDPQLRNTIVENIGRDVTTTQHPYGAMVVDPLLDALDILHASPKLYVLPDDPGLGKFRNEYAGLFGMLEEKPGKPDLKGERFGGADKIAKSNEVFRLFYKEKENQIHTGEFVRARLFDLLVGDWSKHEDNWKWAGFRQDGRMLWRPIPRDRDHVFSSWDGFFYRIADQDWAFRNVEHFGYSLKGLNSLGFQPRHLDRFMGAAAVRGDWIREAALIETQLTDSVIDAAVRNLPPESYTQSGAEIAEKLKVRRGQLTETAGKYYDMLAEHVDVVGSQGKEFFEVTRLPEGQVRVQVFELGPEGPLVEKGSWYDRTFLPEETKDVALYGLGGKDEFVISGKGEKGIRIRVYGGAGDDEIEDRSEVDGAQGTWIFDLGKSTQIKTGTEGRIIRRFDKRQYHYERTRYQPDKWLPLISAGFNQYNGFMFGIGYKRTNRNYDKTDYASKNRFFVGGSTVGNREFKYDARIHEIFGRWDLVLGGAILGPDFHNSFYGIGNGTVLDQALEDADFYVIEYDRLMVDANLQLDLWQQGRYYIGLAGTRISMQNVNRDGILGVLEGTYGIDEKPLYLGATTGIDIDFRDDQDLPMRGVRATAQIEHNRILNDNFRQFSRMTASLEYHGTVDIATPVTVAMRLGAGASDGQVPFQQLFSLGSDANLRGYQTRRFTGDHALYLNSELRWQLVARGNILIPFKFGLKAFYDIGRVFVPGEIDASRWHPGFGGGFYVTPFSNALNFSFSLAFSPEESFFPVVSIGSNFR